MIKHAVIIALITSAGCHKKAAEPAGAGSATTGSATTGSGSATAPTTANAEAPLATQTITECPKALSGADKVNRVIKKECGTVPVTGDYSIDGGTLTLEAGATLAFAEGTGLSIGYYSTAKLIVQGTKDAPVTFTTSGDKAAGFWKGVGIYSHAARSVIDGLVIEYAGGDANGALYIDATDVTVKGSTIRASKQSALTTSTTGALTELSGNTFADIGVPATIAVNPLASGSVGPTNQFPANGYIKVLNGKISKPITWNAKAPYAVLDRIGIDGADGARASLELAPGTTVMFDADSGFDVGYYAEAAVKAVGTKDAPIKLTAIETKEAGGWDHVGVYEHADATFENVVFEFGGADANKAVLSVTKPKAISIKNCTFKSDKRGVQFETDDVGVTAFEGNVFDATTDAIALGPKVMGKIGATTYPDGAKLSLKGGKIDVDTTWKAQAAQIEVKGAIAIDKARLTIEAGTKLVFGDDGVFEVGYYDTAGLQLLGTADKPIELRGSRDEESGWKGIHLYDHARANIVKHVVIHDAGEAAGVIADANAELAVEDYTCDKCKAAALSSACGAKVTATNVKAAGGTPKGEIKPTCK